MQKWYEKGQATVGLVIGVFILVALVVAFFMFGIPTYNVWERGQEGKAELSQADYNRQVQVVNAQANVTAQSYNATAEVERAVGVAKANNVIKNSITTQYIEYLWVQTLDTTKNQIIYVPEGQDGLPIPEAGRATGQ